MPPNEIPRMRSVDHPGPYGGDLLGLSIDHPPDDDRFGGGCFLPVPAAMLFDGLEGVDGGPEVSGPPFVYAGVRFEESVDVAATIPVNSLCVGDQTSDALIALGLSNLEFGIVAAGERGCRDDYQGDGYGWDCAWLSHGCLGLVAAYPIIPALFRLIADSPLQGRY